MNPRKWIFSPQQSFECKRKLISKEKIQGSKNHNIKSHTSFKFKNRKVSSNILDSL